MNARQLLLGSYPPVPGAPAAATMAAAKRAWAAGADVFVASPRPSAAPYVLVAAAAGGRALGREVAALREHLECAEVVLCLEPGWPLARGGPRHGARTAAELAEALLSARSAQLVMTGSPAEWRGRIGQLEALWPVVSVVTASSEALAQLIVATLSGERACGPIDVRAEEPVDCSGGLGPVGPLEPGELLIGTRCRRLVGRSARRVLGPREPAVRAYARSAVRPLVQLARRATS